MKLTKYIIYAVATLATMSFASCDDILDVDPIDSYSDAAVWGDLSLAEAYLNSSYSRVQPEIQKNSKFSSLTDELYQMHMYGTDNVLTGALSPDNSSLAWPADMWNPWNYYYRAIKEVNIFFDNIESVPTPNDGDQEWRSALMGEAYFLRAFFYHNLYGLFGRVPIIDYTFPLETTEFNETRASLAEVEAFIVAECDKAINLLPATQTGSNHGRATKGAAMAVKARTLLWAASPLFDSGYPNRSKWEAASAAHKALIDLGVYSLKPISSADDYTDLFQDRYNPETIFQKQFDSKRVVGSHFLSPANPPSGSGKNFGGWGVIQPTNNIVEKFQINDGTTYVRGAETEYPWANRDLRLYATVILDGSLWGYGTDEREVEYYVPASGTDGDKVVAGQDSREGPGWWNATKTGYLVKKWLNPKHDYSDNSVQAATPGIMMRMAEFYLSYAECQIELGNNAEALKYINLVRERALMPPATGADIRADYEYERQIELVFEGQRWFDLRRWKKIAENYSEPITGIDIVKYNDGSKRYTIIPHIQTRTIRGDHQYWVPIPRAELRRAPSLDPAPYE